jgi:hypothetical protein
MQEANIKIIPDIACGIKDLNIVFDGLPRNSVVCIQAHRKYNKEELRDRTSVV